MPLSLFDHRKLRHYRELHAVSGPFDHWFGGRISDFGIRFVNVDDVPLHLLYSLDLVDPSVPVEIPGVTRLPLLYGFRCMSVDTTFIYRALNDTEVELIDPTLFSDDADIPYAGYPRHFPASPISFCRERYDPTVAEDALALQGIFGLDGLSGSEMARAIQIAFSEKRYDGSVYEYAHVERPKASEYANWTDEQVLRHFGCAPFIQDAPSGSCANPDCPAEVIGHVGPTEVVLDDTAPSEPMAKQAAAMGLDINAMMVEYFGTNRLIIEAHDIRAYTMRVIAVHQPDADDELIWNDPYNQIVFQVCEACHCICATQQCD